jgi:Co/Zn/Cd efflux system component
MTHNIYSGKLTITSFGAVVMAILLLSLIVVQLWTLFSGSYPPFEFSALGAVVLQFYLMYRQGVVSVPSLFGALLVYPGLVPLISEYVYEAPLYALRGRQFQSPAVVDNAVLLIFVAMTTICIALEGAQMFRRDNDDKPSHSGGYRVYFSPSAFAAISLVMLVSAYLTTPGPTLLTVDYSTVVNNYYSWASFAGALYTGSWVVLFLMVQDDSMETTRYRVFLVVTVLGLIWLLLHSRRNESIGILAVLGLDLIRNRVTVSDIVGNRWRLAGFVVTVLLGLSQFLLGSLRDGGSLSFLDYSQKHEYVAYPGGAHNIYGTLQATVALFPTEFPHRLGTTFVRYPIQGVPSGALSILRIELPQSYYGFLGEQYKLYQGGNYILNPYFADFGLLGVVVAGILLAVLAVFAQTYLVERRSNHIVAGIAAVVVVAAFRSFWYTQLAWIDGIQGFLMAFLVYLVIVNLVTTLKKKDPRTTDR